MRERGASYNWPSVRRVSITASVNPAEIRLAEILAAMLYTSFYLPSRGEE